MVLHHEQQKMMADIPDLKCPVLARPAPTLPLLISFPHLCLLAWLPPLALRA